MSKIMFVSRERGFAFRAGRDVWRNALFSIDISIGYLPDAAEGEIPWRHSWHWSTARLPCVIFYQYRWRGFKFALPIGYRNLSGTYRIFWGFSK